MDACLRTYWPSQRCLRCEYDLRGSAASGRCPECGWQFHPATIVIDAWQARNWPRLWNLPLYTVVMLSAAFVLAIVALAPIRIAWVRWLLGAISGYMLIDMARRSHQTLTRHRNPSQRLALFRRSVGMFNRGDSRGSGFRWRDIQRVRVRRMTRNAWRFGFVVRGWTVIDVVVPAHRRAAAALKREINRRVRAAQPLSAAP